MKFLKRLLGIFLVLFFGYWLGSTGAISETKIGGGLDSMVNWTSNILNKEERVESLPRDHIYNEEVEFSSTNHQVQIAGQTSQIIDSDLINQQIVDSVNALRRDQGLEHLEINQQLTEAALVRAEESAQSFSHTRPDGRDAFTVFDDGISYNYTLVGENLGMATYALSDSQMADLIFNGWVDSPGHYENLVRPEFEEIGIGLYYDEKDLYAAQLFGSQK